MHAAQQARHRSNGFNPSHISSSYGTEPLGMFVSVEAVATALAQSQSADAAERVPAEEQLRTWEERWLETRVLRATEQQQQQQQHQQQQQQLNQRQQQLHRSDGGTLQPSNASDSWTFPVALCAVGVASGGDSELGADINTALYEPVVRLVAAITLRRLVEKHWQSRNAAFAETTPCAWTSSEKSAVRRWLLLSVCNSDAICTADLHDGQEHPLNKQLELQLALAAAFACRWDEDFLTEWPNFLPSLLQACLRSCRALHEASLQKEDVTTTGHAALRSTRALHHMLKLVAGRRRHPNQKHQLSTIQQDAWTVVLSCATDSLTALSPVLHLLESPPSAAAVLRAENQAWCVTEIARKTYQAACTLVRFVSAGLPTNDVTPHTLGGLAAAIVDFTGRSCDALAQLQQLRRAWAPDGIVTGDDSDFDQLDIRVRSADRILDALMRYLALAQSSQPTLFRPLASPLCSFLVQQLCSAAPVNLSEVRKNGPKFNVAAILQLEAILRCPYYRQKGTATTEVFSPATIRELVPAVVQTMVPLTSLSVQMLREDPEQYVIEEGVDNLWQHTERAAGIHLIAALLDEFRESVGPFLVEYLVNFLHDTRDGDSLAQLDVALRREAAITVMSSCYEELHDFLDFSTWFSAEMGPEIMTLRQSRSGTTSLPDEYMLSICLLEKSCATLLGNWVAKIPDAMRPTLYDLLINHQLCGSDLVANSSADIAVVLSAAEALRSLVDDFSFDKLQFEPHSSAAFAGLFETMSRVVECQTKMHVLTTVRVLCTQMDDRIVAYVPYILHQLREQWSQATSNHNETETDSQYNLLRQGVIRCVVALSDAVDETYFGAIEEHSMPSSSPELLQHVFEELAAIALPLVTFCCEPSTPDALYLLDDGLELWHGTLQRLPSSLLFPSISFTTPGNLSSVAFPAEHSGHEWLAFLLRILSIVHSSFDHLDICSRILRQYGYHLGSSIFNVDFISAEGAVYSFAEAVLAPFLRLTIGEVRDAGLLLAFDPLEFFMIVCPELSVDRFGHVSSPLRILLPAFEQLAGMALVATAAQDTAETLLGPLPSRRRRTLSVATDTDDMLRGTLERVKDAVPSSFVVVRTINIFARLALQHSDFFSFFWHDAGVISQVSEFGRQALSNISSRDFQVFADYADISTLIPPTDAGELLGLFDEIWLQKIDEMGAPEWRKLSALALSRRIELGDSSMICRRAQVIAIIYQTLQLCDEPPSQEGTAPLLQTQPCVSREERAARADPVNDTSNIISLARFAEQLESNA